MDKRDQFGLDEGGQFELDERGQDGLDFPRVIFPEVLMEYFDIFGWHDDSVKIEVWLDEKNYMERSDYKSGTVISHGFTDEKVI